jgi:molybdate transport system regulatory protein
VLASVSMTSYPRASLRIDLGDERRIGPGKIKLLELIGSTGSISAAAREMEMSYRRAWLLIDEVNAALKAPVVETATGGSGGGGAVLTPFGEMLVATYRDIEKEATAIVAKRIEAFAGKRRKTG